LSDNPEHPYSDDELRRVLAEIGDKTANRPCPMCDNKTWIYEGGGALLGPPKVAFVPMTMVAHFGNAPAIPALTLTCVNCGFIRHHNIPMVLSRTRKDG
jgi:hypothetical protein